VRHVPGRPPREAPLLRFPLADGRPATLLLGEVSTVLSIDDALVASWDLTGRPYAFVRETGTYRRGLDGGLLWKREATAEAPRLRRRLSATEGEPIVGAAHRDAAAALGALAATPPVIPSDFAWTGPSAPGPNGAPANEQGFTGAFQGKDSTPQVTAQGDPRFTRAGSRDDNAEAVRRLRQVVALDAAALREDAARFLAASRSVGILPPDQYLSLVVQVTEGCSWNACTFCRLYRDVPFRWKRPEELEAHLDGLLAYFGPSLALRRSVFLGDANALCLAHDRLLPLVERVAARLPGAPLFSFVDAWTGRRRTPAEWRDYAGLGLRRVYVGLESGDPGLLAWLEKPGSPQDAVDLVGALHESGVAVGVIVLLGAGGERFAEAHAVRTAETLSAMQLRSDDLVYFSEYVDDPGLAYGQRAAGAEDLRPLSPERCTDQRRAIVDGVRRAPGARPPRHATYDIREFVY
jgi:Radical SAM superfamily